MGIEIRRLVLHLAALDLSPQALSDLLHLMRDESAHDTILASVAEIRRMAEREGLGIGLPGHRMGFRGSEGVPPIVGAVRQAWKRVPGVTYSQFLAMLEQSILEAAPVSQHAMLQRRHKEASTRWLLRIALTVSDSLVLHAASRVAAHPQRKKSDWPLGGASE